MAIGNEIYVPLFTEKSTDMASQFFHVSPGNIVQAQAFGFCKYKYRVDDTELQVPQVACLQQALFEEKVFLNAEQDRTDQKCHCPQVYSLKQLGSAVLALEQVYLNGCALAISACCNNILINIPGTYRFVMNDETALGNARVFLRTFTREEFPWPSKFFIGE